MAFEVLSKKYRPQKFSEVVGQRFVVRALQNAVTLNRIGNAYIFAGARGTGKTSMARIFAKSVNCTNPVPTSDTDERLDPCNECASCVSITDGSASDLFELDAASNRGIDEIRKLRESVRFMPVESKYKVYIVDEAHMLTDQASNAILKTLEEPPSYVIFIFATTELHKIVPTVISRCQSFRFEKIDNSSMGAHLKKLMDMEGIAYDDGGVSAVVKHAEGCVRDALSMVDQVIAHGGGVVAQNLADSMGVVSHSFANEMLKHIVHNNVSGIAQVLTDMNTAGADYADTVVGLIENVRVMMLLGRNAKGVLGGDDAMDEAYYQDLLGSYPIEMVFELFQALLKVHNDVKRYSFASYVFEFGMYRCANLPAMPVGATKATGATGATDATDATGAGSKGSPRKGKAFGGPRFAPASATPASATPAPATPAPATPAPATPAPATPATPASATPAPATPASATPAPAPAVVPASNDRALSSFDIDDNTAESLPMGETPKPYVHTPLAASAPEPATPATPATSASAPEPATPATSATPTSEQWLSRIEKRFVTLLTEKSVPLGGYISDCKLVSFEESTGVLCFTTTAKISYNQVVKAEALEFYQEKAREIVKKDTAMLVVFLLDKKGNLLKSSNESVALPSFAVQSASDEPASANTTLSATSVNGSLLEDPALAEISSVLGVSFSEGDMSVVPVEDLAPSPDPLPVGGDVVDVDVDDVVEGLDGE